MDVKQLNKIMKLYFHALKALWDGQGKTKMYYEMSSVKKQLSGRRSIQFRLSWGHYNEEVNDQNIVTLILLTFSNALDILSQYSEAIVRRIGKNL